MRTVWTSPYPDVDIPDVTLYDLLLAGLDEADARKPAAVDHVTGETLTFGQVKAQPDSFATWLAAQGIRPGDVVAIMLPTCPAYLPVFHGSARAGASSALVNFTYTAEEAARQLTLTDARILVTHAHLLATARAAAAASGIGDAAVVVVGGTDPTSGFTSWEDVIATPPAPPALHLDPATHVAALPFSSGTSGMPKAVRLSHRNLVANLLMFNHILDQAGDDMPLLATLPYSHVFALNGNLNSGIYRRSKQVTMSSFDPMAMLDAVRKHQLELLMIVPTIAAFLARHPAAANLGETSVKLVVSGSAPLDAAVSCAVEARLGARFIQGFGMTELSTCTHVTPADRPDIDPGSVGPALPNVRFRVVDPVTGRDVATPTSGRSEPGELWCSGPNVMLGYLGVQAGADATLDADGWIHTGDLVTVDQDGNVTVVDRLKELIKRRGLQIAPVELETVLCEHPGVADAAVLGIASAGSGDQTPHALVQRVPGASPEPVELLDWVAARVAPHKRLGGVHFVERVPRSAAGKILRRELPALVGAS